MNTNEIEALRPAWMDQTLDERITAYPTAFAAEYSLWHHDLARSPASPIERDYLGTP